MVKIFLDTKALLEYMAGKESIVEKVKQYIGREELCLTPITLLEVSLVLKNEFIIEEISNSFTIVDINKEIAEKARDIYIYIEEMRRPSIRQVITASACIINKGFLIPGEKKDYVDVPDLKII